MTRFREYFPDGPVLVAPKGPVDPALYLVAVRELLEIKNRLAADLDCRKSPN